MSPSARHRLEARIAQVRADHLLATSEPGVVTLAITILLRGVRGTPTTEAGARDLAARIVASHRKRVRPWGHQAFYIWACECHPRSGLHLHLCMTTKRAGAAAARDGIMAVIGPVAPGAVVWGGAFGFVFDGAYPVASDWLRYNLKFAIPEGVTVSGVTGAERHGWRPQGRIWASSRTRTATAADMPVTSHPRRRAKRHAKPLSADAADRRRDQRRRLYHERAERRAIIYSPSCTPGPWTHSGFIAAITERFTMPAFAKSKKRHRLRDLKVTEISVCTAGRNQGARILIAKASDGATVELEVIETAEDERRIGGWASIVERDGEAVEDDEGDVLDLQTLRAAAHDFAVSSRKGAVRHGKDHTAVTWDQSVVMDDDTQQAMGVELGFIGWWVSGVVNDDDAWAQVKSGKMRSLSIGGVASREPIEKSRHAGRAMTLDQVLRERGHDPSVVVRKARPRQHPRPATTSIDARAMTLAGVAVRGQELARAALAGRRGAPDAAALAARATAAEAVSKARPGDAIALARTVLLERASARAVRVEKNADNSPAAPRNAVSMARDLIRSRRGA